MSYFLQEGNALNSIAKYQSSYVISNLSHAWNILFFLLLLWMNPKLCLLLRYFSSQSQFAPIEEKYTKQSAELRPSCIVFTVTSWLELPVSVMTFLLISQQLSIYTAYQLTSWFYFSLSHYHLMSQTNIYKISNCLTFIYIFYPIRSHPFKYF